MTNPSRVAQLLWLLSWRGLQQTTFAHNMPAIVVAGPTATQNSPFLLEPQRWPKPSILLTAPNPRRDNQAEWPGWVPRKQNRFQLASEDSFSDLWNVDRVLKTVPGGRTSNGKRPAAAVLSWCSMAPGTLTPHVGKMRLCIQWLKMHKLLRAKY